MLTDTEIRKARPGDKPRKLSDSGGLFLYLQPSGSRLWRCKYRFAGKEKLLSFGAYPDVSLAQARQKRDEARALLREGRDPAVVKREHQAAALFSSATTFEAVAREWLAVTAPTWSSGHAADVLRSLERDVFPALGRLPLKAITAPMVLQVLRAIEDRSARETARRVRQRMSAVFVYGIASGRADTDPAAIVQGALLPVRKGKHPAITDLDEAREILRRVDASDALPATKLAMRLLALTALRPGTLAGTTWSELDAMRDGIWTVPAARMKLAVHAKEDAACDHLMPLSRQALETIDALWQAASSPYVFPNSRQGSRPMSENALRYLLNRQGYEGKHVPHGWRATFSTVMNERYPADHRIIDLMLAHKPKDKVEAAYNRAAHLARRRELAQAWADLLMVDQREPADLIR